MIPLALAAALFLQQPAPQRPAPAPANRDAAQATSRQAITDVGLRVAEVRSTYDLYRRAVFNLPDAMVLQRGQELRRVCGDLASMARAAGGRICRTCFAAGAQRAVERYRAVLPSVSQVGVRCAGQVAQPAGGREAARALRRSVDQVGRGLTNGLQTYEARVQGIREGFGIAPASGQPHR